MKKKKVLFILFGVILFLVITFLFLYFRKDFGKYRANDFGIEERKSSRDEDRDGIDDYTDILMGAKKEAKNKPVYRSAYYEGGYPPDNEGVCTDVIWRALKEAGYSLKDMVDEDIKENVEAYPRVQGKPDKNIDFRRVPNLKVYFERNQISLTKDLTQIEEWQPGDIVVFGTSHIGIISNIRNEKGVPYLIHNAGQPIREENVLELWDTGYSITGHFRMKETD